jgi:hypothetical protein
MEDKELVSDCCGADLMGIVSADGLARCPECHEGCCAEEVEVEEIPGFEGTLDELDNILKKKENE